ncbi:MAG: Zn-ribbon protein [Bacteroidetes bacterium HLUCCA01]|nr:MAG: Zn-ribbon protein [Bacteroidetes bacterium HLUCCA01]
MKEILQNLANLQYIDSRIDELSRLRGDLPEEILELEHEIDRATSIINRLEAQEMELTQERKNLELDLQDSAALIEKYETQQMTVRNNREYDALTKEIESQKQATDNGRSRLEEIAIILEESSRKMTDLKAELADLEETYTSKKSNLTEVVEKTRNEEDELLKVREEAKAKVDTRYLRSYERLRNGLHNGIAVVAMEKGACLGMMLPPQVQNEVRKMNKVIIDENSGRIVIDPEFFENARAQFKF